MNKQIKSLGIFWENLEYGGMSTHINDLVNNDIFKDVKFVIFTNNDNEGLKQIKIADNERIKIIKYFSLNTIKINNFLLKVLYFIFKPLFFILSIIQSYRILKSHKFDIFLGLCGGYGNFRTEMAAIIAAKYLKYSSISISIHHCYAKPIIGKTFLFFINFLISKFSKTILFQSNAVKDNIEKNTNLLKNNKNYEVIHLGVSRPKNINGDMELLNNIFNKQNKDIYKIGMLSRIEESKGHLDLVEAVDKLSIEDKNKIRIYFIGEGTKKELVKLKNKINTLNLNNFFIFTGYLQIDSIKILSKLDLFLSLTKTFEGFGLSLAQSLYAGTPVLSTNVGAVTEFLNNKNSVIIKPNNINEISKYLVDFIENREDWKKRAEIGRKNIQDNFTSDIMCKKIYNHFQKILD